MEQYKNLGGNSGISTYEIGDGLLEFSSRMGQFIYIPTQVQVLVTSRK